MKKLEQKQIDAIMRLVKTDTPVAEAAKSAGVSPVTYHRWKKKFGGGVPRKTAKAGLEAQKLLVQLVKLQLKTDPVFLEKCVELIDLKSVLTNAGG